MVSFPLEQKPKKKHKDKGKKNFTHFAAGSDLMRLCCKWFFLPFFCHRSDSSSKQQRTQINIKLISAKELPKLHHFNCFWCCFGSFLFLPPLGLVQFIFIEQSGIKTHRHAHTHNRLIVSVAIKIHTGRGFGFPRLSFPVLPFTNTN